MNENIKYSILILMIALIGYLSYQLEQVKKQKKLQQYHLIIKSNGIDVTGVVQNSKKLIDIEKSFIVKNGDSVEIKTKKINGEVGVIYLILNEPKDSTKTEIIE